MEQKRVSFEVAKALKEAGYPQEDCDEYLNKYGAIDAYLGHNIARPTYLDAWLWLWREKGIKIILNLPAEKIGAMIIADCHYIGSKVSSDPEEAIEAAIKFLVDNDLIK